MKPAIHILVIQVDEEASVRVFCDQPAEVIYVDYPEYPEDCMGGIVGITPGGGKAYVYKEINEAHYTPAERQYYLRANRRARAKEKAYAG